MIFFILNMLVIIALIMMGFIVANKGKYKNSHKVEIGNNQKNEIEPPLNNPLNEKTPVKKSHQDDESLSGYIWGILILAIIIIYLSISNIKIDDVEYGAIIYPDKGDLTEYFEIDGFTSLESCQAGARNRLKLMGDDDLGTYECEKY